MANILITGVTGQDGSNMVRFLLENTSHIIIGGVRRLSVDNHSNIEGINSNRFHAILLDLTDQQSIINAIKKYRPAYAINFGAQSFVGASWKLPIQTFVTNTMSVMYFLEAIREYCPKCRFYSAGSSEEFGDIQYSPQDIDHPLRPRSPYGASKCAARHIVKVYRDSYNLFAIHCILFNHEGIRRGKEFVTRKITSNIARIKKQFELGEKIVPFELGNIHVKRDWSDSEDFMEAVWIMLNQKEPREYVLSSDETHTVKEFIELACNVADLKYTWENLDDEFKTRLVVNNQIIMTISKQFYRPAEVDVLFGNSAETRKAIGWKPKINFKELVRKMVLHDMSLSGITVPDTSVKQLEKCRLCYSKNIKTSISLGESAYSGIFPKKGEKILEVKISLCKCMDCGLVQLYDIFDIQYMYGENIWLQIRIE